MDNTIPFPKRLKFSKVNPLVDFYSKCMSFLGKNLNDQKIQVWAFCVNNKDYKKLSNLVKKHVKKQYPYLPYKKINLTVGMTMLDIGPRVDNSVEEGFVKINQEELYET
jgi:hypothetical protein